MLGETEIAAEIARRAGMVGAPPDILPDFDRTTDGGKAHLRIDDRYHYVVVERGVELERRSTRDLEELLFWVFDAVTASLAWTHELRHRREGEDPRRQAFARKLELMAKLDVRWAQRCEADFARVLRRAPFDDAPFRARP